MAGMQSGFSCADVEPGAMTRTSDLAADQRSIGQWLPVVRADVFDRVERVADVKYQHGNIVHNQRLPTAVGNLVNAGNLHKFSHRR